jgi:hypothetical protein
MTTQMTPDDQKLTELLAPLADIPPVPHRERRATAPRRWVRPVLVAAGCLLAIGVTGAAIVTSGGNKTPQPGAGTTAPAPAAAPDLGVWFVKDGALVRVPVPDATGGPGAERRALEALLAGSPAGYESEVKPGTMIESFAIADTIATIKLSGRTPVDRGLEQIVATLTDFDDVNWVRFGVEEGLVDRTLASGAVDAAPPVELVRAEANAGGTAISFAGTADTFEANVQVRVVQGDKVLASTFVTATCGSGCRGSFAGTIDLPTPLVETAAGKVRLEAFTTSAEDGSVQNVVGLDVMPAK